MEGDVMTTRTFTLNTEPHEAIIGDVTLFFEPEVLGAEFVQAYTRLREAQVKVSGTRATSSKAGKAADTDPKALLELTQTMRSFVRDLLMPESRETFDGLRLPDRILIQLVEYAAELYGGGSGNPAADGGTSTD